jgi:hypothetical protein
LSAFVAKSYTASFFPKVTKTGLPRESRTVYPSKNKTPKMQQTGAWVKWGGLGAFVVKNSTATFFDPIVTKTGLPSEFRTVLSSKTETPKTQQTRVLVQTGWIGCVRCGKYNCKFFVPKVAKTGLPSEFHTALPSKSESPKTQQTRVLGQAGWIGCVRCEKFNCKFFCCKSR